MQDISDRIIVALDVDTFKKAKDLVSKLYPTVKRFKIGSHLFTACGPKVVRMVGERGGKVFLDLKFYDIPKTVGNACCIGTGTGSSADFGPSFVTTSSNSDKEIKDAVQYPVFMMTVHTAAGPEVLQSAVRGAAERAKELGIVGPYIVGVTVLTSENLGTDTLKVVLERAQLAKDAGLDGVVCAGTETKMIREKFGPHFIIVTPGIRAGDSKPDDQKRTVTVQEAIDAGSNFLVVGRPILEAEDPIAAVKRMFSKGETHGRKC